MAPAAEVALAAEGALAVGPALEGEVLLVVEVPAQVDIANLTTQLESWVVGAEARD